MRFFKIQVLDILGPNILGPPNAEVRESETLLRLYQKADFVFYKFVKNWGRNVGIEVP